MEDVKKLYIWRAQSLVIEARESEDKAQVELNVLRESQGELRGNTPEILRAENKLYKVRKTRISHEQQLKKKSEEFEAQIRHLFHIPSRMPPRGNKFLRVLDWTSPTECVEVVNPEWGSVVTFTADESGPELVLEDGTIIRNMHKKSPLTRGEKVPLYPAGATLRYYTRAPIPRFTPGDAFTVTHAFGWEDDRLLVVKTPDLTIDESNHWGETGCSYKILGHVGLPRIADMPPIGINLIPITGRVIGVEPICTAVNSSGGIFTVSLSEMLIPIEPEMKSAVKKQ